MHQWRYFPESQEPRNIRLINEHNFGINVLDSFFLEAVNNKANTCNIRIILFGTEINSADQIQVINIPWMHILVNNFRLDNLLFLGPLVPQFLGHLALQMCELGHFAPLSMSIAVGELLVLVLRLHKSFINSFILIGSLAWLHKSFINQFICLYLYLYMYIWIYVYVDMNNINNR